MIGVVILAGGSGRRFGSDKALFELEGRRLVDRAVDLAMKLGHPVAVSIGHRPIPDLSVESLPDLLATGPLAGVHAGLSRFDSIVSFAVDMVGLSPDYLQFLTAQLPGNDWVMAHLEGHLQPQVAVFGPRCLPHIHQMLQEGPKALMAVTDVPSLRGVVVTEAQVARFGQPGELYRNLNSLADLPPSAS